MITSHGRGTRGATSSRGGQNRTYALGDRKYSKVSLDMVKCTLSIFARNLSELINLGSTIS